MKKRFTVYLDKAPKKNNKIFNTLSFILQPDKKVVEQGKVVHLTHTLQAQRILAELRSKGIKLKSKNNKGEPITGFQFSNIN
jgi:hypothetical protein